MRADVVLTGLIALDCASGGAPRPEFAENGSPLVDPAAYGDWRSSAPGARRKLTPADMSAPLTSQVVRGAADY